MEKQPIKAMFKFTSVKDKLPSTSDTYLTISETGSIISTLPFSVRHNAFNAHDEDDRAKYIINVAYWAPIPAELAEVMNKIWKEYIENEEQHRS